LKENAKTIPIDHKWSWQIKAEEEKMKEEEEMEKWVSDDFITSLPGSSFRDSAKKLRGIPY